jgi:hypothetical protein
LPLYRLAEEQVAVTVAGLDRHPVRGAGAHLAAQPVLPP